MEISDIKARMTVLGIKQVQLANALNLSPDQISKSFSGIRRFTAAEMDIIRAMLAETPPITLDGALPTRGVPIIGSVAAGNWREAIEKPLGHVPMPAADMPPNAVALRIEGDSMDLLVKDGGTIIFDPDDKSLYPDRYYVVVNGGGEATFKQFRADPARLVPCSTNPAHREMIIGGGDDFQIVGRVIWYAGRL